MILLFLVLNIAALAESPEKMAQWPKHFDLSAKNEYCMVSIWEDGQAVYLQRIEREDGSVWLHFDPKARWGYFRANKDPVRPTGPSIWVSTKMFRMDYLMEEAKLTEIDKTGVQKVLLKRENSIPPEESQNTKPEVQEQSATESKSSDHENPNSEPKPRPQ